MELAATLMWTTHINLTPMYFNKAEGCYEYTLMGSLCGHFSQTFFKKLYLKKAEVFTSMNNTEKSKIYSRNRTNF